MCEHLCLLAYSVTIQLFLVPVASLPIIVSLLGLLPSTLTIGSRARESRRSVLPRAFILHDYERKNRYRDAVYSCTIDPPGRKILFECFFYGVWAIFDRRL